MFQNCSTFPVMLIALVFAVLNSGLATARYFPGSAPTDYAAGAPIALKVDKITSSKTQLPYSFYYLPYCQPDVVLHDPENLGELLKGDLIENTAFDIKMLLNESCKVVCVKKMTGKDINKFISAIDDEYFINILADNLPAAMTFSSSKPNALFSGDTEAWFTLGLPVGILNSAKQHVLMNHWDFILKYHRVPFKDTVRIVGFQATPMSIKHVRANDPDQYPAGFNCDSSDLQILELLPQKPSLDDPNAAEIVFTYSVSFEESQDLWDTRWNSYLSHPGERPDVHWFSIINAGMIVLLLSGIVAVILLRTLLRDIARYNQLEDLETVQEESGWKLVHGDVFRRPVHSKLLAVFAGTGVQIVFMLLLTLILASLGFLSPANRGALVQTGLILFTLMGMPAGYTSARFNKLFDGNDITRKFTVTVMTAVIFPGVCFIVVFILNVVLWSQESSGTISFGSILLLLLLWFGVSLPLVFVGSYFGYRKPSISLPVRTNQIPRQIPPSHWLLNPLVSHAISGMLPFCAVFTELLFIFGSVWHHRFYYLFQFVLVVLLILVITCAEISIAFVYFQLCAENYQWWWRSYWCSAASAVYVFLYGIFYFFTRLNIMHTSAVLLYMGYTALMSYTFFLFTGSIGFISAFFFVRAIYGAIKVD